MSEQTISPASLQWNEQGQPISEQFDDVYFSKVSGLEETRYVFLQHNRLRERWQQLNPANTPYFVIGETGFGTGLNFLAAWQLWREVAPRDAHLHFVSVEKYPLSQTDLAQALSLWPQLGPLAEALQKAYPAVPSRGFHRLTFDGGRVQLTLIIDEASTGFEQLQHSHHPLYWRRGAHVDAWFLDGFAPAKNPDMWRDELFATITRLSHRGTTAATFTAAGIVKRGLKAAGFTVQKVPGFGHKRDMVRADMRAPAPEPDANDFPSGAFNAPYPAPWATPRESKARGRQAIVIGGGLAGCHTARALAERQWQVTLIEQHDQLATEGSGNPQGILYAKLSPKQESLAQFNLVSLQHAQRLYTPLWRELGTDFGAQCGVIQLAHTPKEAALQDSLRPNYSCWPEFVRFLDADQISTTAGIQTKHSGLFFPNAGWIHPPTLCRYLVDHPAIDVVTNTRVAALELLDEGWQLKDPQWKTVAQAAVVVIASAHHSRQFAQTEQLPLKPIRGQVTYLPASDSSCDLKTVLCSEGYIAPAHGQQHCLGATFNLKDSDQQLRPADHQHNLDNLQHYTPDLYRRFSPPDSEQLDGRVAFRCSTRDYLPLAGPAPQIEVFLQDYALLRKNAKASVPQAGTYWPGLYLNVGHGSRGLAYTPLCAELVAAQICGEPLPLPRDLCTALNPARFIIRDLIRNKL